MKTGGGDDMIRIALAIAVLLVIVMFWATACRCEDELNSMDGLTTFDGSVVSVDIAGSSLVVRGAVTATFKISASTKINKDIYPIKLPDIKVGDYVSIGYNVEDDGSANAVTVNVRYGDANIY
jgi:hypothetical protein